VRTKHLALRVTLNSVGTVLVVYLVMQVFGYFRDNLILGISDLSALPSTVIGFISANVLPPMLVLGALLYLLARPIERSQRRLEAGERLSAQELEATRKRILGFSNLVLAMNLLGFAAGYVLLQVFLGQIDLLFRFDRLVILASNLAGGALYATAQSALNGIAFAPLRELLGIHAIGDRRRETESARRQFWAGVLLAAYVLTFLQFHLRDLSSFHAIELTTMARVRSGEVAPDAAGEAWRAALSTGLGAFTSRKGIDVSKVSLPWERGRDFAAVQQDVFVLIFAFLALVSVGILAAIASERRGETEALRRRLREVVEGGGDLRSRLALRSMDDFGELAELINRLLDEFARVVGGIAAEAARTKRGADATALVVAKAEQEATKDAAALVELKDAIEAEAAESRRLREALEGFRGAAAKVNEAAEAQDRSAAEGAAAMEEIAASIESVETMTGRAGSLASSLAGQGDEGSKAAAQTIAAMREIDEASRLILASTGALGKISSDINLLAMNAAIEAAHAGDKGAGFAVVANEVRGLAGHAASETKSIKDRIQAMAGKVAEGVRRSESGGTLLAELGRGLSDSAGVSREIESAMKEQALGTRAAAVAVGQVVEASRTIRGRMAEQGESVRAMTSALDESLRRLDALAEESRRRAVEVRGLELAFASLRAEVAENLAAVAALEAAVGRYKT
jgi:methyl-accepting chemotaxis protein